ncbi:MAG: hypothetical protein A2X12_04930 [Bacteroidetes bacterium GWE2_29_8]|nr:MAG: hypothetical protein A2X12_04930 [Bacteroidetes bacterium GWE2_29_8]
MNKRSLFFLIIILCLNISLFAQNKSFDYNILWSKYDSLINVGLNKSAILVLEDIQKKSLNIKDYPTYLKSLILRTQVAETFTEDNEIASILLLNKELNTNDLATRSIIHTGLAKFYLNYLNRNSYLLRNRKYVSTDTSSDIKTWNEKKIKEQVLYHFNKSVENINVLTEIPINDFDTILIKNGKYRACRPTLYDLLSHYFIGYLYSDILKKNNNIKKELLSPFDDFVKEQLNKNDFSDSLLYNYVNAYKLLTQFHLKNNNKIALLDLDLKRLGQFSNIISEDSIYIHSLNDLKSKFSSEPFSAFVYYELAEYYYNKAESEKSSTTNYYILSFNIANEAILKFKDSDGAKNCASLIKKIMSKYLSVENEQTYSSKENVKIKVEYRNIDTVFYSLYKEPFSNNANSTYYSIENKLEYLKSSKKIKDGYFTLKKDGLMNYLSTELMIPQLPIGNYTVVFRDKERYKNFKDLSVSISDFVVSDIEYFFNSQGNEKNIFVLNRITGEPIANVKINLYEITFNHSKGNRETMLLSTSLTTNKDGFASFGILNKENYKSYRVILSKDNDTITVKNNLDTYRNSKNANAYLRSYLFTDKALYTPGEVVNYKGIVIEYFQDTFYIKPNYSSSIQMFDVNRKLIGKNSYTTNEYGSFSGSFTTSETILNGRMQITDNLGYASVNVEEYKLPTFEVQFNDIKDSYKIGDVINVKGKVNSFSGIVISKAKVTYTIQSEIPWYIFYKSKLNRFISNPYDNHSSSDNLIGSGEIVTDETGNFEFNFKATNPFKTNALRYNVKVVVSDINGETNEGLKTINVSNQSIFIIEDIANDIKNSADSYKYTLKVINSNQSVQQSNLSIKVYSLTANEVSCRESLWETPSMHFYDATEYKKLFPNDAYKGENNPENFPIAELIKEVKLNDFVDSIYNFDLFRNIKEGFYKIIIEAKDNQNAIEKIEKLVRVYSTKNQIPFSNKLVNFINPNTKNNYKPNDTLEFFINSFFDTYLLQEILKKDGSYEHSFIKINKNTKSIRYIVKEADRGGVSIRFSSINQNRVYSNLVYIEVPYNNKQLDVTFSNFRDKTQPATKDKFTLNIKNYKSQNIDAELLICMTDYAVEKIKKNYWNFGLYNKRDQYFEQFNSASKTSFNYSGYLYNEQIYQPEYDVLFFDHFISSDFYNPHSMALKRGGAPMGLMASNAMEEGANDEIKKESSIMAQKQAIGGENIEVSSKESNENIEETMRSKFQESVFFYPNLHTDKQGNIEISYQLPDNITKWKITGLAHTKDLANSVFENYVTTTKPIVITSNLPKFFMENDSIYIIAKISNLTDSTLKFKSTLEIKNALNGDIIESINAGTNSGIIKNKENNEVSWKIKVPKNIRVLNIKISAQAGIFTDGEEINIPIISSKIKLTESLPFFSNPLETKDYKFNSLDKLKASQSTAKINKMIIECTPDPVWNIVYALPYLTNNSTENTFDVISMLYANLISYNILNTNPEIKEVLNKLYAKQNYTHSNLEKNEDIKDILLNQTPWLSNADEEKETFFKLKLLFNNNNLTNSVISSLEALKNLQNSDGGFVWYKGMKSDAYITLNVLEQFGKIKKYNLIKDKAINVKINELTSKAIEYSDNKLIEEYDKLQRENPSKDLSKYISYYFIDYMYVRSFYKEIPLSEKNKDINDTILLSFAKNWTNLSYIQKAKVAIISFRNNDNLHSKILNSLKENAINNADIGTYWKSKSNMYYNNYFNTHLSIIEALKEIQPENKMITEMEKWLIINKQANAWGNNLSTANACLAIIDNTKNVLNNKNFIQIIIGNDTVNSNDNAINMLEGSSYFRMEYDLKKLDKTSSDIRIINKGNSYSYGSLYIEYEDESNKVEDFNNTPLKISKRYFIEKNNKKEKFLEQLNSSDKIKIGDKIIVRFEISADREMEYVMINDTKSPILNQTIQLSGYDYNNGLYYYFTKNKTSNLFFINKIYKGKYTIELSLYVTGKGSVNSGIGIIQSLYAPEFRGNTKSFIFKSE